MQIDREALVHGLSFIYRVIVASAPLLEFAIPKSSGRLRDYYRKHLEEERGHDEMLAGDLKRLGVESIPRFHSAAQLAGSQYYLIAHEHPAMLLGYMRALERNQLSPSDVDAMSAVHGTELSALKHHSIHDPGHLKDIDAEIARLDPELRERVKWNEKNVAAIIGRADG